jgi:hypothetical protein
MTGMDTASTGKYLNLTEKVTSEHNRFHRTKSEAQACAFCNIVLDRHWQNFESSQDFIHVIGKGKK